MSPESKVRLNGYVLVPLLVVGAGIGMYFSGFPLLQGEFMGVPPVNGAGPAMFACQRAGTGHFPNDEQGGLIEIDIKALSLAFYVL